MRLQHRRLAFSTIVPDDQDQVGLTREKRRKLGAEAGDVVLGCRRRHVTHAAAGGDERVGEASTCAPNSGLPLKAGVMLSAMVFLPA